MIFRGLAGISNEAQIIINARVGASPQLLEQIVRETLESAAKNSITLTTKALQCISPGYPTPTYRYAKIAGKL